MGGKPRHVALPLPKNRKTKLGESLNKHSGFLLGHLGLRERGPKRDKDRSLSGIFEKGRYILWQRFCRSELKSSNLTKGVQYKCVIEGEKLPTTNDLDKVGKTMPSSVSDRMARREKKGNSLLQNLLLAITVMFRQLQRLDEVCLGGQCQ